MKGSFLNSDANKSIFFWNSCLAKKYRDPLESPPPPPLDQSCGDPQAKLGIVLPQPECRQVAVWPSQKKPKSACTQDAAGKSGARHGLSGLKIPLTLWVCLVQSVVEASKLPPKITEKAIYFFGYDTGHAEDCFQQWYGSAFEEPALEGAKFRTAEQYMMYMKAQLMKDTDTAQKILECTTPAEAKTLGREVKNFKQAVSRVARRRKHASCFLAQKADRALSQLWDVACDTVV